MAINQQIVFSSLADLARGLQQGDFTSAELTSAYLDRIARLDPHLHAYVGVYAESALLQAQAADLQRRAGLPVPPLHGLPIAVKDLCEIEGQVTTAGSKAWAARRSVATSTVVERLLAAGMIILGKTHMVEFAFGGWGTNSLMGTPRNPWDMRDQHRAPGGSSSGSGVAIAGGLAPAAIGSDTGGSIRAPAAFNGLTGLKTTHGLISLYGTIALSPSLDTIGPMTHTAEDAGLLTAALAGPDLRDDGTLRCPLFQFDRSLASVRGLRIAVMQPAQYPLAVSDDVARATNDAVTTLRALGANVTEIDLPFDFAELMRQAGALMAIEAHHLHAKYINDAALPIGPWVRKRIIAGGAANAETHLSLLADRRAAIARFRSWMQSHDLLLTPTLPFVACPVSDIDEEVTPVGAFNRAVNYLDACAISLPAGFSENGLPIGVQLIAPAWQDALLLQAGQAFQQATDWHRRIPPDLE